MHVMGDLCKAKEIGYRNRKGIYITLRMLHRTESANIYIMKIFK